MKAEWYVATLIMKSVIDVRSAYTPACDEQVRVLRACDSDEAYEKAIQLGKSEEHAYENTYGEIVRWEFVGLVNLEALSAQVIRDGTEIKSRFLSMLLPKHWFVPKSGSQCISPDTVERNVLAASCRRTRWSPARAR